LKKDTTAPHIYSSNAYTIEIIEQDVNIFAKLTTMNNRPPIIRSTCSRHQIDHHFFESTIGIRGETALAVMRERKERNLLINFIHSLR
jgi:hypothetical protein